MTRPFNADSIRDALRTSIVGRRVIFLPSVASTQRVAGELARNGAADGSLVVADYQAAGRGRLGRHWSAPPGTSLLMSLVLRPPLLAAQVHRLTMACSLGIAEGVQAATGIELAIKWPNDVVAVEETPAAAGRPWRKLAGLLAEAQFTEERLDFAVVGMGINVNVEPADLGPTITPATSLSAELGRPCDRLEVLVAVLSAIDARYTVLRADAARSGGDPGTLHAAWAARLVTLGRHVLVSDATSSVAGMAEGVDADGNLLLRLPGGELRRILAGDVSLREPGP